MTPQPSSSRRLLCALLLGLAGLMIAPEAGAHRTEARHRHGFVRVLVKLRRDSAGPSWQHVLAGLGARRERRLRDLRVQVVRLPRRNAAAAVRRLGRSSAVRYAEQNPVAMHVVGQNLVQAAPSDPFWSQQWGAALTEAPTAWAITKGSPNIVVAVVDTGVDANQPDLRGSVLSGFDFVNNDADPADDHGHGTAVAGVVAARADNGIGGSGFCPRCSILPVKVVGADGSATGLNVASGITWATDHGARVINLSVGGSYGSIVSDAVTYATSHGVLVVAAAGNNGSSAPFYPAASPGALSVGATQPDDTLYPWSNYGDWVAVAAPGCDLTTARGDGYGDFCGTSASTPVVSGLAGLAMSYAPDATADAVRQAITSSTRPVPGIAHGRVDAAGILAALGATFQTAPAPAPPVAPPADTFAAPAAPASTGLTTASNAKAKHSAAHPRKLRKHARAASAQSGWVLRLLRLKPLRRPH
jgi:subtilisin family serine protease